MNDCLGSDVSGSSRGGSVAALSGRRLWPACLLGVAAWTSLALATLANAAVPAQQETPIPATSTPARANPTIPNGLGLAEAENLSTPVAPLHRLPDTDATAQQQSPDVLKLAQSQQMCWNETASPSGGGGGKIGWGPCNYPSPSPAPPPAKSSSGSSNSYRQPSGVNNAAAAAAIGSLIEALSTIGSGGSRQQYEADRENEAETRRQLENSRRQQEELLRYEEQVRQAEEQRRQIEQEQMGTGSGKGNPFAAGQQPGSGGNPFAGGNQQPAQGAGSSPDGNNPFAKTAAKPKDPTANYAGQSCAYFTKASDETNQYYYADGAATCYGGTMYVCESRRWRNLGPCDAYAGGTKMQAEKQEKTRFNTKIYESD